MRKAVLPWPSLESPLNKYWNNRYGRFLQEHPYAGKKRHQASIPATPSFREPDQNVALAQRCGAQRKATANAKCRINSQHPAAPAQGSAPTA